MKINEFVTMMNDVRVKRMNNDQLMKKLTEDLEVVSYKPVLEKKELVKKIVDASLRREDGIYKIDPVSKFVALVMLPIQEYTNLEVADDIYGSYDALCAAGLLRTVVDTFQVEFDEIHGFVQLQEEYVLASNSLESKFGMIGEKISEWMGVASTTLKTYMEEEGITVQDIIEMLGDG